jgi:DNA polymerase V
MELNGIPCFQLEEMTANKQQIVCSRSFSRRLTDYKELFEALAEFCSRAAEKLRKQHSVTGCMTIFIRTSPFNIHEPQYQRSATIKLGIATQDTRTLIAAADRLLKDIFKAGYGYQKCGVQLSQIGSESRSGQFELFDFADNDLPRENRPLMAAVDQINRRFPKSISMAATGFERSWQSKSDRISPRYTTDWRELAYVK